MWVWGRERRGFDHVSALPVIYTDEVAAGKDSWFMESPRRMADVVESYYRGCQEDGCALTQGESPALKYLINTLPEPGLAEPAFHCPSFSGCATGVIAGNALNFQNLVGPGDVILGVPSSDWHCNGASLIIRKAMELPDKFLTKLPNGKTLGEQAITVTQSYVPLVEALLDADVEIHRFQPITGAGIAKLAIYNAPFRYRIHTWLPIPPVCDFMRQQFGLSVEDAYITFNMGVGFCLIVPKARADRMQTIGKHCGYNLDPIGEVIEGDGDVVLEHEGGIVLHPPK